MMVPLARWVLLVQMVPTDHKVLLVNKALLVQQARWVLLVQMVPMAQQVPQVPQVLLA